MELEKQVAADLIKAMKDRDALRLEVLRSVKSQIKYFQIEKKLTKLTEADIQGILQKSVKTRRESAEAFHGAGREDLATKEEAEIAILQTYLPEAMTAEALETLVRDTIRESGATGLAQIGVVMKALMPKLQGRADGRQVNEMVRRLLAG